jgi:hypothetical protein
MEPITNIDVDTLPTLLKEVEDFAIQCINNGEFIFTMDGTMQDSKLPEEEQASEWLEYAGPIIKDYFESQGAKVNYDYERNYLVFDMTPMMRTIVEEELEKRGKIND